MPITEAPHTPPYDEGVPRRPDVLREYFESGDHNDGHALYLALTALGTRIGGSDVSRLFNNLPARTVAEARLFAGLAAIPTEEVLRVTDRAQQLAKARGEI